MSSKPTFIFVPGAWHSPEYFNDIREYLTKQGYSSAGVTTPGPNSNPPLDSMKPDVDAVVSVVTPILDQGEDVVLVVHSYGGTVGTQASGLIFDDSKGKSSRGKLRRLVYISAWVPKEGEGNFGPQEVVKDHDALYWDFEVGKSAWMTSNSSYTTHHRLRGTDHALTFANLGRQCCSERPHGRLFLGGPAGGRAAKATQVPCAWYTSGRLLGDTYHEPRVEKHTIHLRVCQARQGRSFGVSGMDGAESPEGRDHRRWGPAILGRGWRVFC